MRNADEYLKISIYIDKHWFVCLFVMAPLNVKSTLSKYYKKVPVRQISCHKII